MYLISSLFCISSTRRIQYKILRFDPKKKTNYFLASMFRDDVNNFENTFSRIYNDCKFFSEYF